MANILGLGIGIGFAAGQGGGGTRLMRPAAHSGADFPTIVSTPSSGDYAHSRYQYVNASGRDITELQVMLASWCFTASNELNSDAIAFKAGVEYPLGTKQAASEETIIAAGTSDILVVSGVNIPAGATFYVNLRGIRQTPTTGSMPFSFVTSSPSKLAYQGTDSGDYTIPGSPQQPTVASLQRGMIALTVMSNEVGNPLDCIALFGDSIQRGVVGIPWSAPACVDAGFVPTNWAVSGARLDQNINVLSKRVAAAKLAGTTIACTNYGINDITNGRTFAQLQGNYLTHWANLKAQGFKAYQHTITCRTTSTDNWATVENQTPHANTQVIIDINNYIRSAPGLGLIDGYFDYADIVMTSRDSGIWVPGYTGDGLHPNSTGAAAAQAAYADFISSIAQA